MEMCSLRDAAGDFAALGVDVYGASLDDVATQKRFHEREELNFALLSDPDGSLARKYGVLPEKARWTKRFTFVIDDKGVLRHVDREVDVNAHGTDLAVVIAELKDG